MFAVDTVKINRARRPYGELDETGYCLKCLDAGVWEDNSAAASGSTLRSAPIRASTGKHERGTLGLRPRFVLPGPGADA